MVYGVESIMKELSESSDNLKRLVEIMACLRAPHGCPWDREQTHESLKKYLAEESAELFDAIDDHDDAGMLEELGDVLLQVIFHAQIASEQDRFDIDKVAGAICEKLLRRHPHVFEERPEGIDVADVLGQWDRIKKDEKPERQNASAVAGVPRSLSALHRSDEVQRKAAKVGFEFPVIDEVLDKMQEEITELREALHAGDDQNVKEEIGDMLFATVNVARFLGLHSEDLLHASTRKFEQRFHEMERLLQQDGYQIQSLDIRTLDRYYELAKAALRTEK
jgi:tetrapyrrole methylase family protein/MazG family protein